MNWKVDKYFVGGKGVLIASCKKSNSTESNLNAYIPNIHELRLLLL